MKSEGLKTGQVHHRATASPGPTAWRVSIHHAAGHSAIHQQILAQHDTWRVIVPGSDGKRPKEIGTLARAGIAELTGKKMHLFLHVKVKEDWSEYRAAYRDSGLD